MIYTFLKRPSKESKQTFTSHATGAVKGGRKVQHVTEAHKNGAPPVKFPRFSVTTSKYAE
jgi:hypothetical protein